MKYSVKNVKTSPSRNGYSMTCSVYKDGKRIGTCEDKGRGGCYYWNLNKGEESELLAYAQNHLKTDDNEAHDEFIDKLTIDFILMKDVKRDIKKATWFSVLSEDEFERESGIHTDKRVDAPYSPAVEKWINEKYGDKVVEIYSKRLLA